jgi:hypothetical protein
MFLATNTVFNHVACTFTWIIAAAALATFEIELRPKASARLAPQLAGRSPYSPSSVGPVRLQLRGISA